MKLRRFGQYQNVTSTDLNAIGEYTVENLRILASLFGPGRIYGLSVSSVSGGVKVTAGAAILNPPNIAVLESDTTVSLSGRPSGTYVILGRLTQTDRDQITVTSPPPVLPNGQPNPFYDPSLAPYTHSRERVYTLTLSAVSAPYTPGNGEIAVATVSWNGSAASIVSQLGQAALRDVTINDNVTPSSDTGSLDSLLSALANRIKALTGQSSWRSNPPTTISELNTNAARKNQNETITGTWTFNQAPTVPGIQGSNSASLLINARAHGAEIRIDEDSSGSDALKVTRGSGGSTTLMVVQNTGNVGIGTTSPAQKLDVSGNIRGTQFISTASTGTAPLQVSSTTKVTNLNADLLDGYDSADFTRKAENATVTGQWSFTAELRTAGGAYIDKKTASITSSPGWWRIAQSPSNAANNAGLFEIRWTRAGVHGHLLVSIGANYGDSDVAINVLSRSQYNTGGLGVSKIRVLQKSTYDPMYIELYVENGDSSNPLTLEVRQLTGYGWQLMDITSGSLPTDYVERVSTVTHPFSTGVDSKNVSLTFDGNVGIGTTTPAEKLEVSGNVKGTKFISTASTGTAPLQVSSTTKVDNLNADLLDGYDSSHFTRKAENATVTGQWTFNNNIIVGAGYTVDGVDISAFKAAYDVHEHNGTDAPKVKAENVLAQPYNGTTYSTTVKAYLDNLQTQINNLVQGTQTADRLLVNQLTVNNTISAGTATATLGSLTVNTDTTIKGDLILEGGVEAIKIKESSTDTNTVYIDKFNNALRLRNYANEPVRVEKGTSAGLADLEIYKEYGSTEIPIYLRFHQANRYWLSLKASRGKLEVRNGNDTDYVDFQAKNITANGTLTATGNVSANGNVTLGHAGLYTSSGWAKGLALPTAYAIFWPKGSNSVSFGIGVTNGGLYFITSGADDASQGASYPVFLSTSGNLGIGTTSPSDKLHVNGNVRATTFIGSLQGNADTATKLATARTISLGGSLSGNTTFDGSANVTISASINSGAVGTAQLANAAVTTDKLADGAVTTAKLASSAVSTDKLVDGAVSTAKIADGAITNAKLANTAVTEAKIADGAVTSAKIANSAVTSQKLAANAVTSLAISDGAVITSKLADNAVTGSKIANGAIEYRHLPAIGVGSTNRMILVERIPLWDGGSLLLELSKYDGWFFLRTILRLSGAPLYYPPATARPGATRKARLLVLYTDNARAVYDPANSYWYGGKLTAALWVRFRDSSATNIVLQKSFPPTWTGFDSLRGHIVELTNAEYNSLTSITHPYMDVGVFWSTDSPDWPTANINGDNVENNYQNYGSEARFWIQGIYLDIVDEY